ncbi:MAG: DUF475 domain-containing protein [Sulfurovum sp.]|nr:MAG: DUF475 domain-containing protein [Sulfurovum sp.]
MKYFKWSIIFSIIALAFVTWYGFTGSGVEGALNALYIALILVILEVSLSFDNAVVNAGVLKHWDERWKLIFLTLGMLVAVFGMRMFFPIFIVSQTADMGLLEVWNMALNNPSEYASKLTAHHGEISAFGGVFLLLVFLNFMFDEEKEIHWIKRVESRLGLLGRLDVISIFVTLLALVLAVSFLAKEQEASAILFAGVVGILTYLGVHLLNEMLEHEGNESSSNVAEVVKKGSIAGFIYLEVLDASFSFDGVIGAFALTTDVVIIMVGLGIGALFVRSMTIYLVEKGTLGEYIYLEHGAHYAIGTLAIIMLLSIKFHIPEIVTGGVGALFIIMSIYSSVKYNNQNPN